MGTLENSFYTSLGTPIKRTIASGEINVQGVSYVAIETEGAASTDDLTHIRGGVRGQILHIEAFDDTHDVVLIDYTGADNSNLNISGNFTMDSNRDEVMLVYGENDRWNLISESSN